MPPRARKPVGVALVDKPAGPTSFALVAALRRTTGARTGHAGTLDPFATGLMVLLSGAATSVAPCFVGLDKRYVTDIDLTATTATADVDGEILERHAPPARTDLDTALAGLRGEVELPIPAVSAVKIGGERAYRLARRGVEVEMPRRRSHVFALDVISYSERSDGCDSVRLALHVGSGTYVRSIATALGGHCTTLRRTSVGPFEVAEATMLDPRDRAAPMPPLMPLGEALGRLPVAALERVPAETIESVLAFASGGGVVA